MALVRILVDGYSLLHAWPKLAAGKPRHSRPAREELIARLIQYHDACGTPITVVFDGESGITGTSQNQATPIVEVLFSRSGQTADQMIERAAHRLLVYGEVLVVTDDSAERDTVHSLGGMTSSCLNFIQTVDSIVAELDRDIKNYNLGERNRFKRVQR
ncbi:MAG: hypothetical protein DME26_17525 [Verrucomicrobia bacterium]|nr:MAG: hypothetical protein DME26_17525 [Verrucomicrobiota bacterium]